jgi:hypothetical protein
MGKFFGAIFDTFLAQFSTLFWRNFRHFLFPDKRWSVQSRSSTRKSYNYFP